MYGTSVISFKAPPVALFESDIVNRNKYKNIKTEINGIKFDSKLEAERYTVLKLLERAKEITNLELQVPFDLHAVRQRTGEWNLVGRYKADFVYMDKEGRKIVEDTKGVETATFKWKRKHFEIEYYPLTIQLIKRKAKKFK